MDSNYYLIRLFFNMLQKEKILLVTELLTDPWIYLAFEP